MYRIGQLNRKLQIYNPAATGLRTPDGGGGFIQAAPELFRDCWCYKRKLSGAESVKYQQIQPSETYVFVVRNHPTKKIAQSMSLVFAARTYDIVGLSDQDISEAYVEITAKAQSGEAIQ